MWADASKVVSAGDAAQAADRTLLSPRARRERQVLLGIHFVRAGLDVAHTVSERPWFRPPTAVGNGQLPQQARRPAVVLFHQSREVRSCLKAAPIRNFVDLQARCSQEMNTRVYPFAPKVSDWWFAKMFREKIDQIVAIHTAGLGYPVNRPWIFIFFFEDAFRDQNRRWNLRRRRLGTPDVLGEDQGAQRILDRTRISLTCRRAAQGHSMSEQRWQDTWNGLLNRQVRQPVPVRLCHTA